MPQPLRASLSGLLAVLVSASVLTPANAATLTWSIVPSPNAGAASSNNFLQDVSCVSANACVAVGIHGAGGGDVTLTESWNGSAWSVVPSPNPASITDWLNGVSCTSSTACTAVGGAEVGTPTAGRDVTLIESWNGAKWSIVPSPNGQGAINGLIGVSCVSATVCTAVGNAGNGHKTLIESWNGAKWSIVPGPSKDHPATGSLNGVSCLSASSCTAVGNTEGTSTDKTLIESWDGRKWSVVASPNAGTADYFLGVSCASSSACTAVGNYSTGTGRQHTLAESWNGKKWSIVASPGAVNTLYGVSCPARSACAAVGSTSALKAAIESWNGTRWSIVGNPQKRDSGSELYGVSCASATTCTAVGYYFHIPKDIDRTLAESGRATG